MAGLLRWGFSDRWRRWQRLIIRWCAVGLLLVVLSHLALPGLAQQKTIGSGDSQTSQTSQTTAAPVKLGRETLFYIRTSIGPYSPEVRARATTQRIHAFARDRNRDPNTLSVYTNNQLKTVEILAGREQLVVLVETDGTAVNMDLRTLAYRIREQIETAVGDYRTARTPRKILAGIGYALLSTVVFLLLLLITLRGSKRLKTYLQGLPADQIPALRFLGAEILSADRVVDVLWEALKLLRLIFLILLTGFFINLILGFFPWTKGVSDQLFEYAQQAALSLWNGFISYLPNLFFVILIIFVTNYVIKILKFFFTEVQRGHFDIPGFYPQWAKPTFNIVRVLVIFFAATVAYPYLPGSDTAAFQGISIFLGALFTLGSSSAIANMVAGVVLIYSRAFEIGDRVKISDAVGDVLEKSLFVTRIRTPKNVVVSVPNAMVLSGHIINYTTESGDLTLAPLILHTTITLGYDLPWRKVYDVLITAALETDHILDKPLPFVLQTSLDDFYVSYELNAYTNKAKLMPKIYSELHQNIQDKCNEAGIEILSPHYRAVRDGHQLAVPEEYFPENYQVPGFRLQPENGRPHDQPTEAQ